MKRETHQEKASFSLFNSWIVRNFGKEIPQQRRNWRCSYLPDPR